MNIVMVCLPQERSTSMLMITADMVKILWVPYGGAARTALFFCLAVYLHPIWAIIIANLAGGGTNETSAIPLVPPTILLPTLWVAIQRNLVTKAFPVASWFCSFVQVFQSTGAVFNFTLYLVDYIISYHSLVRSQCGMLVYSYHKTLNTVLTVWLGASIGPAHVQLTTAVCCCPIPGAHTVYL